MTKQRPGEPVSEQQKATIKAIAEAVSIPVIANGGSLEFQSHADLLRFRAETGCSSVMVARAAQHNLSIFSPAGRAGLRMVLLSVFFHDNPCQSGLRPKLDVARDYLRLAIKYDNNLMNTKYNLNKGLHGFLTSEPGSVGTRAWSDRCSFHGIASPCS